MAENERKAGDIFNCVALEMFIVSSGYISIQVDVVKSI